MRSSGFTLIELVVTLAIIGIMVAFAVPAFVGVGPADGAAELRPLRTLLLDAKRRSDLHASEVEVTLVPETGRYRLEERRPGASVAVEEGTVPLRDVRSREPADRFRVIFRAVGIGVGDSLSAGGRLLHVDPILGSVVVR